jgi:signal transduction histidine kinase
MEDVRYMKLLEEDLLWEVEVNASIAGLAKRLIMPNDIREISILIINQLQYITKSKLCLAGHLDPEANSIIYIIQVVDENDQSHIYDKKLSTNSHHGDIDKILKNEKSTVINEVKEKNGLSILLDPYTVQRYILTSAIINKKFLGQIGIANSSLDYNERDLMFVRLLADFYGLAIQRYWSDNAIYHVNKDLEKRIEGRTKQLSELNKNLKNEIKIKQAIEKELKRAKKNAEVANKAKSDFIANMSHELRTPLNHIIGFTELVLDENFGKLNKVQSEYLSDVHYSSMHLLSLINDILDLAKVEAGKLKFQASTVNLQELIEGSLTMIKEKAIKHGIKLSSYLNGIPDTITADGLKLKQIMYNLLSNAAKFTPDGGQISVTAELYNFEGEKSSAKDSNNSSSIMVSVADTGVGINPEDLDRIFKPFEQIDNSASREFQGTGLGLSLTKKLVELHGGQIWVESEGLGKGSIFRFTIPTETKEV